VTGLIRSELTVTALIVWFKVAKLLDLVAARADETEHFSMFCWCFGARPPSFSTMEPVVFLRSQP
jgi:hypothetical protein